MTGLEKIVEKISEQSEEACLKIIDDANQQASDIILKAKEQAIEKANKIVESAKKEADRINAVARSSAESITRTKYLETKNAVLNDILSACYEETEKMSDKDYFDLLFRLCVKNTETGECMLYLNENDLARLPEDFQEKINGEVYERAAVQVSKKPRDIENGFILDYGDFEVNCTLRAIFDDNMDMLKDTLSKMLFN